MLIMNPETKRACSEHTTFVILTQFFLQEFGGNREGNRAPSMKILKEIAREYPEEFNRFLTDYPFPKEEG